MELFYAASDFVLTEADQAPRRAFVLGEELLAFMALPLAVAEKGLLPAATWKPRTA